VMEFPILAPLTWIRKIKTFGWTSVLANVFIGCGLIGILAYCSSEWANSSEYLSVPAFNKTAFPMFLGTAVYAYEGIGMVVPIFDSLSQQGQRRFPVILTFSLVGIASVYIIIGIIPFLYLEGIAHVPVQDAITLNLPRAWWAYLIVVAYCIALVFSFPLMLFPAVQIVERGVAPFFWRPADKAIWKSNLFRSAFVAIVLAVSYVGASQLDNLVSLVGCFCCTPLAFIFPAMFHYKLIGGSFWVRLSNIVIALFGFGIFIFSTYQAISTWTISTVNSCVLTPGNQ
jgi:proton-coupled amino acid transporter